jgi:hypothetical protein
VKAVLNRIFFFSSSDGIEEEEKKVSMLLSTPTARLLPTVVIAVMSFVQRTNEFICFIEKKR